MRTRSIVLLLLALHLTGCGTWTPTRLDPVAYIEQERPSWVRVSLPDGERRRVRHPTIRDGSIVDGRARCTRTGCEDSIDLEDVTQVESRKLSVGRTVLALGVVFFVGAAMAFEASGGMASPF